jgi:hypothetical protein
VKTDKAEEALRSRKKNEQATLTTSISFLHNI